MPACPPGRAALALLPLLLLLSSPLASLPKAAAEPPMRVLEVRPAARSVMDGNRQEVFVRFSGPVDHQGSRLAILQEGRVVRSLEPRLNASPDTLYAVAGGLPPGAYTLRWEARSRRDGASLDGTLDFTVR